ncbi:type VII secretion protein EsaA [Bacillus siamensis]|uniref:Type VII secretion protein EsaA n=1 Tax=Bacillus siamensis TaxID=659243 RepID=A0AAI8HLH2_9BACI|nr:MULTISPECIES: type VII secretion protein EsaA [Bacillus]AME07598.1 integrase [Bacillus sp. SDLI1]AUJ76203.1 type VII secretion protein EsaA [Bacillus siamensis]UUA83449.1 type VII secretion protein EsaA [Bacillus siamensis]
MTEQRKSLIKLIAAVVIILVLPVLFFRFIGDDPGKQKINATRQIAVVNEDMGLQTDENEGQESVHFGKEVAAALGGRPDYSWTVVNRSAAENGLAAKKYDAVVYIPSDFSKDILSYDKERPQKATLTFNIQSSLNAVNKEKVQRELEDAQKSMNKKMSALYWNFVSQKVNNVRGDFDKIVNKESEFQNVMYNFYKPSSNDLAGEIKRQKDLIDELKKSMNEAQGAAKEKLTSADEAKNTLKDFADTVERYKQYQENQKKLLMAAQEQNQKQITTGLNAIKAQQAANQFSAMMSGLSSGINQAQTQLDQTGAALFAAQQVREAQVPDQEHGMGLIQSNLINDYQNEAKLNKLNSLLMDLIPAREKLTVAERPETESPEDSNQDQDKNKDQDQEDKDNLKLELQDQRDELKEIAAQVKNISDTLKEEADPDTPKEDEEEETNSGNQTDGDGQNGDGQSDGQTQEHPEDTEMEHIDSSGAEKTVASQSIELAKPANESETEDKNEEQPAEDSDIKRAKEQLIQVSQRIQQIEEELREKENTHNEKLENKLKEIQIQIDKLNSQIEELINQVKDLNKDLKTLKAKRKEDFNGIKEAIIRLENKDQLQFVKDINTFDINDLLNYYRYLSAYDSTLFGTIDSEAKSKAITGKQGEVQTVLAIKPEETASWENLKNNKMQTDEDISHFIKGMTEFSDNYSSYIRDEQAEVLNELASISDSAAKASDQLAEGAVQEAAAFSGDGLTGTMALGAQDTVGREVLQMSDTMGHLSERQSGIISYTDNMQQSVNDVQHKADTLNSNWGKNVDSTKLIRNDVYGILGNALVDGQENGYVYDYLANPLKISGEVPEDRAQNVPPVVILVIVLISSLLIGYFSSYYQQAPLLVKGALFGILNIMVGLMISLFGLNIYSLPDDQTIKWSVFTILLLAASSAFIRAAFVFGSITGWIASSALILFYVAPLIDLIMPNFSFDSPVSKVYIDIQYGTGHLFAMGITVLAIITLIAAALPLIIRLLAEKTEESDQSYEA